ncbi:MAG TPA: endonuclease MutS2 [Bryobacteraceae bacterium]|nr:endonuclease MutS2 [Bryobacteraceae bacterium]
MSFRGASLLQFDELKELIASFAGSAAGKERVLSCDANESRAAAEADLSEAGEAIVYLHDAAQPQRAAHGATVRLRFDQLRDLSGILRLLRVEGARLDGLEILDLFHVLSISGEYRAVLVSSSDRYPRLGRRAQSLIDLRDLVRRHQRAFLPDGSLADEASVALGRIRRDIERQQRGIQQSLERFLRSHRGDGTLQEDFVTIRDDRFVVPIVAGQKARVDGVIHGSSGSGHTLYIEPLETIGLNNELVRLREDELREVERILAEITSALQEHADEIRQSYDTLASLDFIFAKAEFALQYGAVVPRFSVQAPRRFRLREARHPLLEAVLRKQKRTVVPISFELDEQHRVLLISGPNTGGKTVTMKTAGLLTVMAHAGLPVPCEDAEIPWLEDVLADIGDTQSIAESLSTFSGHLLHVKGMLETVTPDTLVLLDELGGSTDPDEGGALGVAILDRFRQCGAFCIASTHLLPLKLYGAQTPGVLNASMGFDEATLQPTYRLRIGMPGKSAGLDIATRLNLPPDLIEHARGVMPQMQADLQSLLGRLHAQMEDYERRNAELEQARGELEGRRTQLEKDTQRREEKRVQQWERQREELIADFEARAMDTIEKIFQSADERKAAERAPQQISRAKREFREQAETVMKPALSQAPDVAKPALTEGMKVRLRDVREPATVRRILKNGAVEVEAGFLRMQVAPGDVIEVLGQSQTRALPKNVTLETGPRWDATYREINLIGKRAEEAIEEVDKFLDSAALASVDRVRIIHGHGMGVLKRAVNDYLGKSPHVSRFYPAAPAEGGTGATIAELRE